MSYTPTVWKNGDVVTAEKLNKLENGVANAGGGSGGGGVLIVTDTDGTLDKTWAEINAAAPLAWIFDDGGFFPLTACFSEDGEFGVVFAEFADPINYRDYAASSESAYPTRNT